MRAKGRAERNESMPEKRLKLFLLYSLSVFTAAAIIYVSIKYLLAWTLPFLTAGLISAAAEPAVVYLQRNAGFRRGFSSLLLTLFVLFILGGLLSLLISSLSGEAGSLLSRIPALIEAAEASLHGLIDRLRRSDAIIPVWLREREEEILEHIASETGSLLSSLADRLPSLFALIAASVPKILLSAMTTVLAIYFTLSSFPDFKLLLSRHVSAQSMKNARLFYAGFSRSLSGWMRAELTLCSVTFAELLLGFSLIRQPYALLISFLITLVDALPVFGTGTVLIPWMLIELVFQNTPKSLFLAGLYILTMTVRNALEPRLLSAQTGLPPVASLFAMYIGFCSLGVAGMVLLPFLLLLASQAVRQKLRQ